jgi:hypothetical protein
LLVRTTKVGEVTLNVPGGSAMTLYQMLGVGMARSDYLRTVFRDHPHSLGCSAPRPQFPVNQGRGPC